MLITKTLEKTILEIEDVKSITPNFDVLKIINKDISQKSELLVFDRNKRQLTVLTTNKNPDTIKKVIDKIASKGFDFKFYYTDDESFKYALSWYDEMVKIEQQNLKAKQIKRDAVWKEAIQLIKELYEQRDKYWEWEFIKEIVRLVFQWWSSDLHFQSEDSGIVMRVRKDWVLKKVMSFSYEEFKKYLTKLKFMAWVKLNINYLPQDWRFSFNTNIWWVSCGIDVRVSFMPWLIGENIVMRFLDSTKSVLSFSDLGFMDITLETLKKALTIKEGMILVTWPTWSWKTTTLYSILNHLNDPGKKIITLEDPVEYQMPGIQQSQIDAKKWYNYEDWLKAILRQDPDIIMVWEIRTVETALIAVNAALTWHLVLTTLHTNSAIEAISRLLNMWVAPYLLAPALSLVIAQRLLRRLDTCHITRDSSLAEKHDVEDMCKKINDAKPSMELTFDGKLFEPAWCEHCWYDWYKWRIASLETFEVNNDIKNTILKWKSTLDIYAVARWSWYLTMKEDAYIKMIKWFTTLDEIRRVL